MRIQYIEYSDIDFEKWNTRIMEAPNGMIYGIADFLNIMCEKWDALIAEDYISIMPLIRRRKFGIDYLYQPPFIQQSGIFGNTDAETLLAFIRSAKKHFKFAEINFNFNNATESGIKKNNQIILLNEDYEILITRYTNYAQRKIKQAAQYNIQYSNIDPSTNIRTYQDLFGIKTAHVAAQSYDKLILFHEQNTHYSFSRGLWVDGQIAASVSGIKDHRRIHLLTLTAHNRNAFPFATHALIDQIIKEFSGQELILDFEGSELPGVYAFNEGFGAINQPYFFYRWNHLPWPLNYLK
ncbi:MAG: hypothetical protein ACK43L_00630 [Sphingobacteriales bacterium]